MESNDKLIFLLFFSFIDVFSGVVFDECEITGWTVFDYANLESLSLRSKFIIFSPQVRVQFPAKASFIYL